MRGNKREQGRDEGDWDESWEQREENKGVKLMKVGMERVGVENKGGWDEGYDCNYGYNMVG